MQGESRGYEQSRPQEGLFHRLTAATAIASFEWLVNLGEQRGASAGICGRATIVI